jgi:hypothetical protein
MFVVMTAVEAVPFSANTTRAFCTAMAETPSMAAMIMLAEFSSTCAPAVMQTARKAESR